MGLLCFVFATQIVLFHALPLPSTVRAGVPRSFVVEFGPDAVTDLRQRLNTTRWPQVKNDLEEWEWGASSTYVKEFATFWGRKYDFTARAKRINDMGKHLKVEISTDRSSYDMHYITVGEGKKPLLLLLHGWPGSVLEFEESSKLLRDEFDLIIPSLPGFGWSTAPKKMPDGIRGQEMLTVFRKLVEVAGGGREYLVQGGDYGAFLAPKLCDADDHCLAVHINMALNGAPWKGKGLAGFWTALASQLFPNWFFGGDEMQAKMAQMDVGRLLDNTGYMHIQATRPQTLAFALADSPAGMAAWIIEKLQGWTGDARKSGNDGGVVPFSLQQVADLLSVYWFTNSMSSSITLYRETFYDFQGNLDQMSEPTLKPLGYTATSDLLMYPERFMRFYHPNYVYYKAGVKGGHFFSLEQPKVFADEVKSFYRAYKDHQEGKNKENEL